MKNSLLFLLVSFFAQAGISQTCLPNGITLTTQEQIDDFAINYSGCTQVGGDVIIKGWYITNLDGLSNLVKVDSSLIIDAAQLESLDGLGALTAVGGDFVMQNLKHLKSMPGFNGLTTIGGDFFIEKTDSLTSISNFGNLTNIGGNLHLINNKSLLSLNGLEGIETIGGEELRISRNSKLMTLSGLDNFKTIGGSVKIFLNNDLLSLGGLKKLSFVGWNLTISNNEQLASLDELSNLTAVGGSFKLNYNEALKNLSGLEKLSFIGGDLGFMSTKLTTLDGLDSLTILGGGIYIGYNDSLKSVGSIFQRLDTIDRLKIERNDRLSSLQGFETITTIDGDLILDSNPNIKSWVGLQNLTKVTGEMSIWRGRFTSFQGLEKLKTVQGRFSMGSSDFVSCSGLDSLTNIGGVYCSCDNIQSFQGMESLSKIGGGVTIVHCDQLKSLSGWTSLDSILGFLEVMDNDMISSLSGLDNVSYIGGKIKIWDNSAMQNISALSKIDTCHGDLYIQCSSYMKTLDGLKNLKAVEGDLYISGNMWLTNLSPLSNLSSVGGGLTISSWKLLESLQGLEGISSLGGKLEIRYNKKLTSLQGLENLTSIDGHLYIRNNENLLSIGSLSKLTSIFGALEIASNDQLKTLSGLENLSEINGVLAIYGNDLLTDISALQNVDPESLPPMYSLGLSIRYNKSLSNCAINSVCKFLEVPSNERNIEYNKAGCNSDIEVMEDCGLLSGFVYYDYNQDKLFGTDEIGLANRKITISPGNDTILTDENGFFYFLGLTDGVTYQVDLVSDPDWQVVTDFSSFSVTYHQDSFVFSPKYFGLYPNFSAHDATINISSNSMRCNSEVSFFIRYKNTGTYKESGEVYFYYDELTSFVSAEPMPSVIDSGAHKLIWFYDSITPFFYKDIIVNLKIPDQNSAGEELSFLSEIYDANHNIFNGYGYRPIVLCSFDPNDKLVMPFGEKGKHYTLHDEKLTYTVRFQNTGNAEAIDITIRDTMDINLDMSTFRVINSSFEVQTAIKDHAVEFFFKDIWLPDSTSNEPESHGFVTYEIRPVADLDDYTKIENTAHIIFDSNEPIVTNTTKNTMVTAFPVGLEEPVKGDMVIRPNPTNGIFYVTSQSSKQIGKVLIYNQLGQLVHKEKTNLIDITHLPKGLYTLKIELGDGIAIEKLVLE